MEHGLIKKIDYAKSLTETYRKAHKFGHKKICGISYITFDRQLMNMDMTSAFSVSLFLARKFSAV